MSCITCRAASARLTYLLGNTHTHTHTRTYGEQSLSIPAPWPSKHEANILDSICCSLWWRDNALAKHYNQQAREVTASPRITTAQKCLSLAISMSATLTPLPPSPLPPCPRPPSSQFSGLASVTSTSAREDKLLSTRRKMQGKE